MMLATRSGPWRSLVPVLEDIALDGSLKMNVQRSVLEMFDGKDNLKSIEMGEL